MAKFTIDFQKAQLEELDGASFHFRPAQAGLPNSEFSLACSSLWGAVGRTYLACVSRGFSILDVNWIMYFESAPLFSNELRF